MQFVLENFNKETQYVILENHKEILDNDTDIIAVLSTPLTRKSIGKIAAEWRHISKLIEILKETGNSDFHLYYEDCDIWVLEWHNPELDGANWVLADGF